jgi:HAD superfamily hydrolase (TIGR01458 family)
VTALRRLGLAVGFVTNTTSRPRREIHERLTSYGVAARPGEIATALRAGATHARAAGLTRVAPYVPEAAHEDLDGLTLTHDAPDALIVGDLDTGWDFATLNRAFRQLMDGARLVALSRDRYWLAEGGLRLDSGTFVAALEYATGARAELCGKPSEPFYRSASGTLGGLALDEVMVVGDDLWADIDGAGRLGMQTCLVRTGKFREDVLAKSGVTPNHIVDSIADVPTLVSGLAGAEAPARRETRG